MNVSKIIEGLEALKESVQTMIDGFNVESEEIEPAKPKGKKKKQDPIITEDDDNSPGEMDLDLGLDENEEDDSKEKFKEVMAAFNKFIKSHGENKIALGKKNARVILAKFKAKKTEDLKPEDYDKVLIILKKNTK